MNDNLRPGDMRLTDILRLQRERGVRVGWTRRLDEVFDQHAAAITPLMQTDPSLRWRDAMRVLGARGELPNLDDVA